MAKRKVYIPTMNGEHMSHEDTREKAQARIDREKEWQSKYLKDWVDGADPEATVYRIEVQYV